MVNSAIRPMSRRIKPFTKQLRKLDHVNPVRTFAAASIKIVKPLIDRLRGAPRQIRERSCRTLSRRQ
jgi:hypothetical protein